MSNILFISLGCDKNLVDSEKMLGLLAHKGHRIVDREEDADVIVVNTCCFIHDAKEESVITILEMAEWKKAGRLKALIVAGCLAPRYAGEMEEEIDPETGEKITFLTMPISSPATPAPFMPVARPTRAIGRFSSRLSSSANGRLPSIITAMEATTDS